MDAQHDACTVALGHKSWHRERSMGLWQMDIVGGAKLADGRTMNMETYMPHRQRIMPASLPAEVAENNAYSYGVLDGDTLHVLFNV